MVLPKVRKTRKNREAAGNENERFRLKRPIQKRINNLATGKILSICILMSTKWWGCVSWSTDTPWDWSQPERTWNFVRRLMLRRFVGMCIGCCLATAITLLPHNLVLHNESIDPIICITCLHSANLVTKPLPLLWFSWLHMWSFLFLNRRRLPVVMTRLRMAQRVADAVRFVEQGRIFLTQWPFFHLQLLLFILFSLTSACQISELDQTSLQILHSLWLGMSELVYSLPVFVYVGGGKVCELGLR